ncbi:LOW QUALITY PROTEIN: conserved hypothetical protein, partial [Brucella suis bv. 3 str. 686]
SGAGLDRPLCSGHSLRCDLCAFVIFALYGGAAWFANPIFLPAWIFGILTIAAGWFLLQPGLGIGWAASKLPNAGNVRILNLIAHTFFSLGMYGTALILLNTV